jgi:4-amino-4-deoxy-L-arabinose transferase-like glycosyltransferase
VKTTWRRSATRPYLTAVLLALGIRLLVIPFLYHDWMDPFVLEHWAFGRVARSIAQGHGFGNPLADTGPSALLPPIYCYLLAGIFKLFGIYTRASIVVALALNSFFSALTCIPIFRIAERCFESRVAQWACWGWALSPYGIYYGADWAWSTCMVTLLLAWLFLIALDLENSSKLGGWLTFGFWSGFAALIEPVVLSVLPLLGAWTIYRASKKGRFWLIPGASAVVVAILVVSPWIARNYSIFHKFIPVRSGFGLELYIGNNGDSQHWVNRNLHPNHSDQELNEYVQRGEIAYMDHKKEQAFAFIASHPGWYVGMTIRRALYLWTGYWSLAPAYLAEEPLDPPNIFVATTMTILAFTGLGRLFRRDSGLAVRFMIVLGFFPLAYYFSHPETYYLRPLDPILVLLAAYAVVGPRGTVSAPAGSYCPPNQAPVASNS